MSLRFLNMGHLVCTDLGITSIKVSNILKTDQLGFIRVDKIKEERAKSVRRGA